MKATPFLVWFCNAFFLKMLVDGAAGKPASSCITFYTLFVALGVMFFLPSCVLTYFMWRSDFYQDVFELDEHGVTRRRRSGLTSGGAWADVVRVLPRLQQLYFKDGTHITLTLGPLYWINKDLIIKHAGDDNLVGSTLRLWQEWVSLRKWKNNEEIARACLLRGLLPFFAILCIVAIVPEEYQMLVFCAASLPVLAFVFVYDYYVGVILFRRFLRRRQSSPQEEPRE